MIKARVSAPAYMAADKVAVPIEFFDDADTGTVLDTSVYLVAPDDQAIVKLSALIVDGINGRRQAANGVAGFNQAVPVGTVIG